MPSHFRLAGNERANAVARAVPRQFPPDPAAALPYPDYRGRAPVGGENRMEGKDKWNATNVATTPSHGRAATVAGQRLYTFCSVDLPPCQNVTAIDYRDLFSELTRPFLVCGDINGNHSLWGDSIWTR